MTQPQSIFPTRGSLDEVLQEGLAMLPITEANQLVTLLQIQRNTLEALSVDDDGLWKPDSHWDDHDAYPPEDWCGEVERDDTRLGYADWVNHKLEDKEHDNET